MDLKEKIKNIVHDDIQLNEMIMGGGMRHKNRLADKKEYEVSEASESLESDRSNKSKKKLTSTKEVAFDKLQKENLNRVLDFLIS